MKLNLELMSLIRMERIETTLKVLEEVVDGQLEDIPDMREARKTIFTREVIELLVETTSRPTDKLIRLLLQDVYTTEELEQCPWVMLRPE